MRYGSCQLLVILLVTFFTGVRIAPLRAQNAGVPQWIAPYTAEEVDAKTPCPILRSVFRIEEKPASGTVRIIGLGHYELFLNGKRVGDSLIGQPWSQ